MKKGRGWRNESHRHRMSAYGIKTRTILFSSGKPKIDMRKRYLIGSEDDIRYMRSYDPLEYIEYLKLEDAYEQGKITNEQLLNGMGNLGKPVKRKGRTIDFYWDGDKDDAKFELWYAYMELGMLDQAIETREELQRRGFRNWNKYIAQEEELREELQSSGQSKIKLLDVRINILREKGISFDYYPPEETNDGKSRWIYLGSKTSRSFKTYPAFERYLESIGEL